MLFRPCGPQDLSEGLFSQEKKSHILHITEEWRLLGAKQLLIQSSVKAKFSLASMKLE